MNKCGLSPLLMNDAIPDYLARAMGKRAEPCDHVLVETMLPMGLKLRDLVIEQAKALGYRNPEALYTTADFGKSLAVATQHVALQSRAAGTDFLKICVKLPLKDHNVTTIPQVDIKDAGDNAFDEHGEPKVVQITDNAGLSARVSRRERFFGISDEVVVNDSIGLLSMFSSGLGTMAARNETREVASLLKSNPVLPDGRALFNVTDGTLRSSGASVTSDLLSEAFNFLRHQKTNSGNEANNAGKYLVVSCDQEVSALQAVREISIDPKAPRLEVLTHPALSSPAWIMLADPEVSPVIGFLTLLGSPTVIITSFSFGNGYSGGYAGILLKVTTIFGVVAISRIGAYMSPVA